jgi:sugar phosphate isomerase/epimerase
MTATPIHRKSRRSFLTQLALASGALNATFEFDAARGATLLERCPIGSFSKIFQELNLNYEDSAALIDELGLDGIDCPVRPGGQVLPERAADDLPRYEEALRKHGRTLLLLTTAILSPKSPHAESILRLAQQFGVKFYRLGYWSYKNFPSREKIVAEARAQLKDLAALNKQFGLCGVYQNHSGRDNFGATLSDLREALENVDAAHIGVAFDPSHALFELGDGWRDEFEKLRPYFKIAYIKDGQRAGNKLVKFGTGELGGLGWFARLKELGYTAPISMHTEYEWAGQGNPKKRAHLVAAMKADLAQLRRWLAEA